MDVVCVLKYTTIGVMLIVVDLKRLTVQTHEKVKQGKGNGGTGQHEVEPSKPTLIVP